jgi:hypothetical protein
MARGLLLARIRGHRRMTGADAMTTLDIRDLETVSGGTLDNSAARLFPPERPLPPPPRLPGTIPPGTIPLGPFCPAPDRSNIA